MTGRYNIAFGFIFMGLFMFYGFLLIGLYFLRTKDPFL